MSWLPDDVREASGGEVIDRAAHDAVRLAHRALDRFPDLVRQHKVIAGGAAISSSLVVLAGVAIAHRMRRGQSAEDAVRDVTEEEIQGYLPDDEPEDAEPGAPEEADEAPAARVGGMPSSNGRTDPGAGGVRANGHHPDPGADALGD